MDCAYYRFCNASATHSAPMRGWSVRQPLCAHHASRRPLTYPNLDDIPTIYLLHFDRPLSGHAQHYLGSTITLSARLAAHAAGNGSRLMTAVADAGIGWQVAATWRVPSGQSLRRAEATLKRHGHLPHRCPICRDHAKQTATSIRALRISARRYGELWQPPPDCSHLRRHPRCRACKRKVA